jgi:hypothetical protein
MPESETREQRLTLALREAIQYLDLLRVSDAVPPDVRQRWEKLLAAEEHHLQDGTRQKLREEWNEVLAAEARNFHLNAVFLGGPLTPREDPDPPAGTARRA